ncbi:NADPH-dependent 7-cyano-7-deazaguanine reductase QueF [Aliikangiella sp. IMCC44359]|uniref:NADPH-dependent 7-cyano-7-deazaguanine reductase QueF n=1 Tax=Aliikangiella sp. IMCC44359 TaxID=3459125 RepID=UPI00403AAAD1
MKPSNSPLGQPTKYISQYAPELLFSIARVDKRLELGESFLGFSQTKMLGEDIWNAYELSWLNDNGVPQVAVAEIRFDAASPFIVESKSLKLYLNSFNQTRFTDKNAVIETINKDLTSLTQRPIKLELQLLSESPILGITNLNGKVIDDLDIQIDDYQYSPSLLQNSTSANTKVKETLVSHLLKSNCLITSQPDWASIQIKYAGNQILHSALLRYLVSFRSHNEFHEQCVERIFCDIKHFCQPEKLTVYARYTRRGGLDINPWRSDFETSVENCRLVRQ